jgi:murein DD-endopeptidase MepM/ murein hydrolase activator NlpD
MPVAIRRSLVVRLASERMIPIVAALVVLGASVVSLQPAAAQPIGNANGGGGDVRLVVGGEVVAEDRLDPMEFSRVNGGAAMADLSGGTGGTPTESYADDGTIYKPIAVNTVVHDGKGLLQSYTVQTGDTLTGIASRYGVTMMTVWWANKLTSKDDLHVGQKLVIPPVNGLIVNVKDGDTLDNLAATYKVDPLDVVAVNQLDDPTLIIGQTLILPDAVGAPIPTPKPVVKSGGSKGGGSCNCSGPSTYGGGTMAWPVVGGGNYISQYFHYGHYGLDIAADYGSKVRAAAAGRVTFAGWKNNGGGYQVWISHGSGLYTTYNHMSSISVSTGASVGKGQQVGRVGQSGWATGPHLHFEVWKGPIWNGGTRVNPLKYL